MNVPTCAGLVQVVEGERLATLAEDVPAGRAIVEIGSHTGLSTIWMALHATRSHVVAVDPWPEPRPGTLDDPFELETGDAVYERFSANVTEHGLWRRITPLRMTSLEAARVWLQPVGLLFIDAIHEYDHVASDYLHWSRHLPIGSWLAFHDWIDDPTHPYHGVKRAIDEHVVASGEWSEPVIVEHLWTAQRLDNGSRGAIIA